MRLDQLLSLAVRSLALRDSREWLTPATTIGIAGETTEPVSVPCQHVCERFDSVLVVEVAAPCRQVEG